MKETKDFKKIISILWDDFYKQHNIWVTEVIDRKEKRGKRNNLWSNNEIKFSKFDENSKPTFSSNLVNSKYKKYEEITWDP